MRKWTILGRRGASAATAALLVLAFAALGWGAVSGDCVNCHTMHNSQDGTAVDFNDVTNPEALPTLLKSDCVGCHSNLSGSDTIVTLGTTRIPIVYNSIEPVYPSDGSPAGSLAGGNFYWTANLGDAYGHNVAGISAADGSLTMPPGGQPSYATANGCSYCHGSMVEAGGGCQSCHLAAHHKDDNDGIANAGDGWYRMLGSAMTGDLNAPGVVGIEDPNWEQIASSTQHNVYKGTTDDYTNAAFPVDGSIGSFCAGCHSNFHHRASGQFENGGMSAGGAWIRHPSDVLIPDSGEYAAYTTFDPLAPVAKTSLTNADGGILASDSVVEPGVDVVMCLSCHRPHGSPYPDMLRWDYVNDCNTGNADSETEPCGCYTCHTTKDGI